MFKHVLVAVDGSEHAKRAVEVAAELAAQNGSKLTLIHVQPHAGGNYIPEELKAFSELEHVRVTEQDLIESVGREILENAEKAAAAKGVSSCGTVLEIGDPARNVVEVGRDMKADLIVMGRRGLGDVGGLFLGSVSHKVAHSADCCCLTVK